MKDSTPSNGLQEFLSIKSKTWTRDSHGLFDYESNVVKENILLIQNESILIRRKHELKEIKDVSEIELGEQHICNVLIKNSKQKLSNIY
jgi:hypothetical protein